MNYQLRWKRTGDAVANVHLEWRCISSESPSDAWKHYKQCPFAVPDYDVPGGSKGWSTAQVLLKMGANYAT